MANKNQDLTELPIPAPGGSDYPFTYLKEFKECMCRLNELTAQQRHGEGSSNAAKEVAYLKDRVKFLESQAREEESVYLKELEARNAEKRARYIRESKELKLRLEEAKVEHERLRERNLKSKTDELGKLLDRVQTIAKGGTS